MKKTILTIYIIILLITLCGCNNNQNNNQIDQKIQSEIEYLDKKLIGVMNKLNNISLENYEVKSKEIVSESQGGASAQGGLSGGESSGGESSGGQSGQNQSGGGSNRENQQDSGNIKVLQMQPSNILVINKDEIDWVTIKSEVETLYSSWNSILLDLYSANVANEDILNFSAALDNAVVLVKSEDEQGSLVALANLYSFLPRYMEKISVEESKKNIIQTKSNILNAYAQVEQENWSEIHNQISQADATYSKVMNDVNYIESKEELNRSYILIKELQNSINVQDKDIFYIKYKNLMNSIQ